MLSYDARKRSYLECSQWTKRNDSSTVFKSRVVDARLFMDDLHRRCLHDDHLRLRRGVRLRRLGRRRRLSVVDLSADLTLQAREEADARERVERGGHADADQRAFKHARPVNDPPAPGAARARDAVDAARPEAIARARALRDRPEVARSAARRVQAVTDVGGAAEERVLHVYRGLDAHRARVHVRRVLTRCDRRVGRVCRRRTRESHDLKE